MTKTILVFAISLLTAGCAIHPSPKDVMPYNTVGIVDRIKCETHFAIFAKAIDKLEHNNLAEPERSELLALAERLKKQGDYVAPITVAEIPGKKAKEFYNRYINATIAYEFSLVALEENANSTEVDFARVITNGTVSVPFSASNDHMRQSTKTFLISETFKELLAKKNCEQMAETPNLEYPISGSIGIYDIIDTFIELNEEKDLTAKASATGIYADAVVFTTTTMGSVVPKLVLTPPTQAFHLTGAMFNSAVTRRDTDTVNIGLSLPTPKAKQTAPAQVKANALFAIERQRGIQVQNSIIQFFSNH